MTKHLHAVATRIQDALLRAGWPTPAHLAVMRDAWASLYRWNVSGEHVYRIRTDVRAPAIPADLDLATAPVARPGVCYVLDRDQWLVIARHAAMEPVVLWAPDRVRAYDSPMLTYATELNGSLASGAINLGDSPTPAHLRIPAGTSLGTTGVRQLTGADISEEMLRLVRVLPWYYHPDPESPAL